MMELSIWLFLCLWAIALYIAYSFVTGVLLRFQHARTARKWKCEAPVEQKFRLPLGVDRFWRSLQADKDMRFLTWIEQLFREIDALTVRSTALGTSSIFTVDENNIRAILATQFSDFDIGPSRRGNFFPLLGNGIFTQDGAAWQHSRAMLRPQFAREQVSDLDLEERHLQSLVHVLPPIVDGWTAPVDLQTLFFRLTLDTATEFLFGLSINSQLAHLSLGTAKTSKDKLDEKAFANAFDRGGATLATRLRLKDKYWLVQSRAFAEDCRRCHDFIDHFVHLTLAAKSDNQKEQGHKADGRYIFLEALAAETRDPIELRSQILHMLLAGRDTTASLLSWLFYYLVRDPARYDKLRRTVLENFGSFEKPAGITFRSLKDCKYLQHCISEALRLYPVVPLNTRQANKDTTLPRGGGRNGESAIFIPKGTQCDYSVYAMHRRVDIWGPDAAVFNPERWEGRRVGWEFLPFNGGPRICIGQQFALTEASYITVRLLQRFDRLQNLETDPVTRQKLGLTVSSGNGVKMALHVA